MKRREWGAGYREWLLSEVAHPRISSIPHTPYPIPAFGALPFLLLSSESSRTESVRDPQSGMVLAKGANSSHFGTCFR